MKKLLIIAMALMSLSAMAQPVATPTKPGINGDAVTYFLPKSAIRLQLLIEKRVYTPGDFCKYAEKYLRMTGIEQEEVVTYTVVNFGINQIGVRDTSKCYTVKLKGKTVGADIRLNEEGVLQAVNAEPVAVPEMKHFKPGPQPERINPRQYLSAEVLAAGSMAKMAELTVQQIIELQERRQALITGEADDTPADKQQLQLMLDEIEKEREALMSMFLGTTTRDTTEQIVTVCPDKEVEREVIFRINKKLGLVDKDDLSGIPYYMTVQDMHRTPTQQYDMADKKKEGGFWVNVPGRIKVTLQREEHLLGAFDLYAAQFGFVECRSGSLFTRYVTHMILNPVHGSVDRINAEMPK